MLGGTFLESADILRSDKFTMKMVTSLYFMLFDLETNCNSVTNLAILNMQNHGRTFI